MPSSMNILILAAGQGKRMGSPLPKVLHTIGQRSMLCHVIATALALSEYYDLAQIAVVHGPDHRDTFSKNIKREFPDDHERISLIEQTERLGTGHAVQCGLPIFVQTLPTLVLYGDQPLMGAEGLAGMLQKLDKHALCLAAFETDTPHGFGRLVASDNGNITKIVEEKEANDTERAITLCNAGVMALGLDALTQLSQLKNDNAAAEYYLTDLVALCLMDGKSADHIIFPLNQMASVNNLVQLAETEAIWQQGKRFDMLSNGVQMMAPETVYFSVDTKIAAGCFIEPNVVFGRDVTIAQETKILAFSHIEATEIGKKCQVGPFSRIRPKTVLDDDVKVGNFVEVKNSHIQSHSRASHHAYLGDCYIEQSVNIGAGTISCNYDGKNKHVTQIGAGAFIGTNSSLVAPLKIGQGAVIGAGSVIADDVGDGDLSMERNKQINIKNGGNRLRDRQQQG